MQPNWYNFADYLQLELPELRDSIEESYLTSLDAYKDPYPHVFLDEIIGPLLIGSSDLGSSTLRIRAGEILDTVLTCPDEDLSCAAVTSILEVLRDNSTMRESAWPFLGKTARSWLTQLVAHG